MRQRANLTHFAAFNETGKIFTGKSWSFWLVGEVLLHFTSPIRRYPDLQIHRIIKEQLHGTLSKSRQEHYEHILPSVCDSSSKLERRADEAERETDKLKKSTIYAPSYWRYL